MKKILAILSAVATGALLSPIAVVALFAVLFILLIPINMLLNNANLRVFERSFAAIEHPKESESLALFSRLGNLGCASNHCDYFVENLRVANLSQNDLLAYYKNAVISPPPDPSFGESEEVRLWFFDDERFECEPEVDGLFNRQTKWGADLSAHEDKTLYIAYAEAPGAPPGADIRCR